MGEDTDEPLSIAAVVAAFRPKTFHRDEAPFLWSTGHLPAASVPLESLVLLVEPLMVVNMYVKCDRRKAPSTKLEWQQESARNCPSVYY